MADHPSSLRVPRRAFRGAELVEVSAQARAALGEDALILSTRVLRSARGPVVEIVAAAARDVERFERALTAGPLPARRPFTVALVGPTGAGKTTTAIKLATHPDAFGARRVGLLTLDTYRAGAVAQIETFADVAGLPLEVAYDVRDARGALSRLAGCEVVVVDTPGRGPHEPGADWRAALAALAPDEVHLVLPATMRSDLAEHVRAAYDAGEGPRVTHALLTKLDEVPGEVGVADLAAIVALPARWTADGQAIPADLGAALPRLLNALGGLAPTSARPFAPAAVRRVAEVAR